ncbi:hypothetical protein CIB84_014131 [Bambusicola thoracicus]|uniref:RNA helicase n=1 Tax=Bambusicola thoracicus TaxID=9083 RepID=A0A2P4SDD1_BAMTH|nr:hypothetical protein CIB84_014131 [Bambusicola thoracicus]
MKFRRRRFTSSAKLRQKGIEVLGKWKSVEIDPNIFVDEQFKDVVCLEELTEYKLVSSDKVGKGNKQKRKSEDLSEEGSEEEEAVIPPKKKKKYKDLKTRADKSDDSNAAEVDVPDDEEKRCEEIVQRADHKVCGHPDESTSSTRNAAEKKKKKKKEKVVKNKTSQVQDASPPVTTSKKVKNWTAEVLSTSTDHKADVSAWKDLFVPQPVLKALSSLGFSAPTPIQALTLPSAIRDNMDVLGAAETGINLLTW